MFHSFDIMNVLYSINWFLYDNLFRIEGYMKLTLIADKIYKNIIGGFLKNPWSIILFKATEIVDVQRKSAIL